MPDQAQEGPPSPRENGNGGQGAGAKIADGLAHEVTERMAESAKQLALRSRLLRGRRTTDMP
jgi:hypothetical protein